MKGNRYLMAITDTHGNNQALGRVSANLRHLMERYNKPLEHCALLYLGDAMPLEKIPEKDIEKHYRDFANAIGQAELPVIGVPGNHDITDAMKAVFEEKGWHLLHGDIVEHDGLRFGGYGGSRIPDTEFSERMHGLPKERFADYDDNDLIAKLAGEKMDVFLTHIPPYKFADLAPIGEAETPEGRKIVMSNIGGAGINFILGKTKPILNISGHVHHNTASTTAERILLIKCKGFYDENKYPVYYVEIVDDAHGIPYVRSNVDMHFTMDGIELIKPLVSCREEYDCTDKEITNHYRIFKDREKGLLVRTMMTENGQKVLSQRPALLSSDDISWAFADSDDDDKPEASPPSGRIILS